VLLDSASTDHEPLEPGELLLLHVGHTANLPAW
jgi:hypothetical protein